MRLDDIERMAKIHAELLEALEPFIAHDGAVHYAATDSLKAAQEIAKKIISESQSP